jgi:hypothetical protein
MRDARQRVVPPRKDVEVIDDILVILPPCPGRDQPLLPGAVSDGRLIGGADIGGESRYAARVGLQEKRIPFPGEVLVDPLGVRQGELDQEGDQTDCQPPAGTTTCDLLH